MDIPLEILLELKLTGYGVVLDENGKEIGKFVLGEDLKDANNGPSGT